MNSTSGLALTIAAAMAAAILLINYYFSKRAGSSFDNQFDERQLISRNKAYTASFFVTLLCLLADIILKMTGKAFYYDPLGELICIFIGITVFSVLAIRNDAFIVPKKQPKSNLILYFVITLIQFGNAFIEYRNGTMTEGGKLTVSCLSAVCGLTFAVILVTMLMKLRQDTAEE